MQTTKEKHKENDKAAWGKEKKPRGKVKKLLINVQLITFTCITQFPLFVVGNNDIKIQKLYDTCVKKNG